MYLVVLLFAGTFISTAMGQKYVPGEIVIKLQQQPTPQALLDIEGTLDTDVQWRALQHAPHAKGVPNQPHPLSYYRIANVDEDLDIEDLCVSLNSLAGVALACVNRIAKPSGTIQEDFIPNDIMFSEQLALKKIGIEGAWSFTTGNPNIVIAIIDTGCRLSHVDIEPNLWENPDEIPNDDIDNDGNMLVDDVNGWNFHGNNNSLEDNVFFGPAKGHGTGVSGIAAGRIDNGAGIAGVSNAKIMTLKWTNQLGLGCDATVASCIHYAVDHGAQVINMSIQFSSETATVTMEALDRAHDSGVTVVAPAGNATSVGMVVFPASHPSVIAVGGINHVTDQRFGNYGSDLDVIAPAVGVLSPSLETDSDFSEKLGTSFASPHVAGLAALMLSVNPTLTPDEIRSKIRANATHPDAPIVVSDDFYGYGLINAAGFGGNFG